MQPSRLEEGLPGPTGLDRGADPLEALQRVLPGSLSPIRIRRHQRQLRAARKRLAKPHPGADAERLRRPGRLSDHLRPAGLRRQRHWAEEELATPLDHRQ